MAKPPGPIEDAQEAPVFGPAGLWGHAPVRRRLVILEGDPSIPESQPPLLHAPTSRGTPQCAWADHWEV